LASDTYSKPHLSLSHSTINSDILYPFGQQGITVYTAAAPVIQAAFFPFKVMDYEAKCAGYWVDNTDSMNRLL